MKQYMLDTNTVSYILKKHPVVIQHLTKTPITSLCISVITEAELLFGLAKRPIEKLHVAVKELLRRVDILSWETGIISECYATTRVDLERQGKVLSPLDLLIASHALAIDAVLVTNDQAFHYVKHLNIEDWTKPLIIR